MERSRGMRGIQADVVAVELRLVSPPKIPSCPVWEKPKENFDASEPPVRLTGGSGLQHLCDRTRQSSSFPSNRSSARFLPCRRGFRRWLRGALPCQSGWAAPPLNSLKLTAVDIFLGIQNIRDHISIVDRSIRRTISATCRICPAWW